MKAYLSLEGAVVLQLGPSSPLALEAHLGVAESLGERTKLQVVGAEVEAASTRERHRDLIFASPVEALIQSNTSSTRLRQRGLIP